MIMSLLLLPSPTNFPLNKSKLGANGKSNSLTIRRCIALKSCPINPPHDPVLKQAFKEPIAFMGGIFAGILRLDLNEDPLKEWVTRTVEASGIVDEENDNGGFKPDEDAPQQINIE